MRDRKEIELLAGKVIEKGMQDILEINAIAVQNSLILEVLLDIRDLLQNRPINK